MIPDFLRRLRAQLLSKPFTAERSEIVDRIDQWEDSHETQVHDKDPAGVEEGNA